MKPPRSRTVRVAVFLETYLQISTRVGLSGTLFFGSLFLLYIVVGMATDVLGLFDLPYPFLSFEADPFFVIGGAVLGLFMVQASGSLILYHFLVGAENDRSQFTILLGFISLGFGGGLLRLTLFPAIRLILNGVV